MNKKELIKTLKNKFNTSLEKRVLLYLLSDLKNNNFEGENFEKRLYNCVDFYASHPCVTGVCNELITYHQTARWFDRYKRNILEILQEYIDEDVFTVKENFEKSCYYICMDRITIKLNYNNKIIQKCFNYEDKNVLAWFSFETIVNNILNFIEELYENN